MIDPVPYCFWICCIAAAIAAFLASKTEVELLESLTSLGIFKTIIQGLINIASKAIQLIVSVYPHIKTIVLSTSSFIPSIVLRSPTSLASTQAKSSNSGAMLTSPLLYLTANFKQTTGTLSGRIKTTESKYLGSSTSTPLSSFASLNKSFSAIPSQSKTSWFWRVGGLFSKSLHSSFPPTTPQRPG